jgi:hypothetical protein
LSGKLKHDEEIQIANEEKTFISAAHTSKLAACRRFLNRRLPKHSLLAIVLIVAALGTGHYFLGRSGAQSLPENCFSSPGSCGYPDPNYNNNVGSNSVGVANCSALPNFSTSNLPAGTYYSGSGSTLEITGNDVTINNLNMGDFDIYVSSGSNNFTFENSCISTGDGTEDSVGINISAGATNVNIDNDTISGAGTNIATSTSVGEACTPGAGVSNGALGAAVDNDGTGTTIDGLYVYNAGSGAPGSGGGTDTTVENSYELINTVPACEHDEPVYFSDAAVTLHHNVLFNAEDQTAAVFGDVSGGTCTNNLTMTDNFVAGGDYAIYPCGNASSVGTSTMDIENNRFARCLTTPIVDSGEACSGSGQNGSDSHGYYPSGGTFGVAAYYYTGAGQTWAGNYWDNNLDQVNIDSSSGAPVANPGPAVAITSPVRNTNASNTVTITASATTGTPATVHDVQFQVDGTNIPNCDPTTPTSGSTYACTTWDTTALSDGNHTLQAIVTDSNHETASSSESITIDNTPAVTYSIWAPSATPVNSDTTADASNIVVGTKFQSSEAGYILGVRFYKGIDNTGAHVGTLWTSGGSLITGVTFTNETASGWQQMLFSAPVAISANTTYVVAYYAPNGNYAADHNGFTSSITNGPLTALQNDDTGGDGGNGVYGYGGAYSFPDNDFEATNYWVDTIFSKTLYIAPSVSLTAPTSGASVNGTATITANASGNAGATISDVQFQVDGTNIPNCDPTTPTSGSTYACTTWDTTALTNGSHTIQALVTDSNNETATRGETVTLNNPTPTATISASPTTINAGSSSSLTWSSTYANSCNASGAWSGSQAANNSSGLVVTPTATSTYSLICSGAGGTSSQVSTTVTVIPAPTPTPTPASSGSSGSSTKTTTSTTTTTPAAQTVAQGSQTVEPTATASPGVTANPELGSTQQQTTPQGKTKKQSKYVLISAVAGGVVVCSAFGTALHYYLGRKQFNT